MQIPSIFKKFQLFVAYLQLCICECELKLDTIWFCGLSLVVWLHLCCSCPGYWAQKESTIEFCTCCYLSTVRDQSIQPNNASWAASSNWCAFDNLFVPDNCLFLLLVFRADRRQETWDRRHEIEDIRLKTCGVTWRQLDAIRLINSFTVVKNKEYVERKPWNYTRLSTVSWLKLKTSSTILHTDTLNCHNCLLFLFCCYCQL